MTVLSLRRQYRNVRGAIAQICVRWAFTPTYVIWFLRPQMRLRRTHPPGYVLCAHRPKVHFIIYHSYLILLCPMVGDRSVNQTSCLCGIMKRPVSRAAKTPRNSFSFFACICAGLVAQKSKRRLKECRRRRLLCATLAAKQQRRTRRVGERMWRTIWLFTETKPTSSVCSV